MEKLTPSQMKTLTFLYDRMNHRELTPTLREICEYMKFSAVGSAQDVVFALKKKGFLEASSQQAARSLMLTSKALSLFGAAISDETGQDSIFTIHCLGSVPAGNPLEAVEERVGLLSISTTLLPRPKPKAADLFALRASGLSMIDAGIMDGDWLVVQSKKSSSVGRIVVATLSTGEATVKRLMKDPRRGWFLKPENDSFKPIFAEDFAFTLVGEVLALQRSLLG